MVHLASSIIAAVISVVLLILLVDRMTGNCILVILNMLQTFGTHPCHVYLHCVLYASFTNILNTPMYHLVIYLLQTLLIGLDDKKNHFDRAQYTNTAQ